MRELKFKNVDLPEKLLFFAVLFGTIEAFFLREMFRFFLGLAMTLLGVAVYIYAKYKFKKGDWKYED